MTFRDIILKNKEILCLIVRNKMFKVNRVLKAYDIETTMILKAFTR